jgi:hypothetical protein
MNFPEGIAGAKLWDTFVSFSQPQFGNRRALESETLAGSRRKETTVMPANGSEKHSSHLC